jgi:hypothetical protein
VRCVFDDANDIGKEGKGKEGDGELSKLAEYAGVE